MTIAQIAKIFSDMGFLAVPAGGWVRSERVVVGLGSRNVCVMEVKVAAEQAGIDDEVVVERHVNGNVCVYPK